MSQGLRSLREHPVFSAQGEATTGNSSAVRRLGSSPSSAILNIANTLQGSVIITSKFALPVTYAQLAPHDALCTSSNSCVFCNFKSNFISLGLFQELAAIAGTRPKSSA